MASKKFIGKTSRVNFDVPEVMHEDLHNLAEVEGTSVSDLARRLLADYIAEQKINLDIFDFPKTQNVLLDKFIDELSLITKRYRDQRTLIKEVQEISPLTTIEEIRHETRERVINNLFESAKKTLTITEFTNFTRLYLKTIHNETDAKKIIDLMLGGFLFLDAAEKL